MKFRADNGRKLAVISLNLGTGEVKRYLVCIDYCSRITLRWTGFSERKERKAEVSGCSV